MKHYHKLDLVAIILLLIGGICWGLIGLFNFDLVTSVLGMAVARIVFVLVGLAALYRIIMWVRAKAGK